MAARELAAQGHRLGDGEDRLVGMGAVRNPERIEPREKLVRGERRRRHSGNDAAPRGAWQGKSLRTPSPSMILDRPDAGVAQG